MFFFVLQSEEDRLLKEELLLCVDRLKVNFLIQKKANFSTFIIHYFAQHLCGVVWCVV